MKAAEPRQVDFVSLSLSSRRLNVVSTEVSAAECLAQLLSQRP